MLLLLKSSGVVTSGVGAPAPLPHLSLLFSSTRSPLAAAQGSYSVTGQNAGLTVSHILTAAQGSYSVSGQAASLVGSNRVTADQGTYSISGQDINFVANLARPGSPSPLPHLALLGGLGTAPQASTPAPLPHLSLLTGLGYVAPSITAVQGAYTVSGQDAVLRPAYVLAASSGTFSLAGQASLLTVRIGSVGAPAPLPHLSLLLAATVGPRVLTADPAIYTIAGSDGLADFEITDSQGSYAIAGQDAAITAQRIITADFGTYAISGQASQGVISGSVAMVASGGSYAISGIAANTPLALVVGAGQGFYATSGQAAGFAFGIPPAVLTAQAGAYSVNGITASLIAGTTTLITCQTGTYNVTGISAVLTYAPPNVLVCQPGTYNVSGIDAALSQTHATLLTCQPGTYDVTGGAAVLTQAAANVIPCGTGTYGITGVLASLRLRDIIIQASSGAYGASGENANLTAEIGITYTKDSRARIGGKHGGVRSRRGKDGVASSRIGEPVI